MRKKKFKTNFRMGTYATSLYMKVNRLRRIRSGKNRKLLKAMFQVYLKTNKNSTVSIVLACFDASLKIMWEKRFVRFKFPYIFSWRIWLMLPTWRPIWNQQDGKCWSIKEWLSGCEKDFHSLQRKHGTNRNALLTKNTRSRCGSDKLDKMIFFSAFSLRENSQLVSPRLLYPSPIFMKYKNRRRWLFSTRQTVRHISCQLYWSK